MVTYLTLFSLITTPCIVILNKPMFCRCRLLTRILDAAAGQNSINLRYILVGLANTSSHAIYAPCVTRTRDHEAVTTDSKSDRVSQTRLDVDHFLLGIFIRLLSVTRRLCVLFSTGFI